MIVPTAYKGDERQFMLNNYNMLHQVRGRSPGHAGTHRTVQLNNLSMNTCLHTFFPN